MPSKRLVEWLWMQLWGKKERMNTRHDWMSMCKRGELTTMIGKWWIDGKNTLASFFLWYNRKYCQNTFTDIFYIQCLQIISKIFVWIFMPNYFLFCYENIWIFHAKNDIRLCFHQYFNVLVNYVVSSFCTSEPLADFWNSHFFNMT